MSDDRGPTLVSLPDKDVTRAAIDKMKRDLPNMVEYAAVLAQLKRAYFVSLVEAGFTEQQALELSKTYMGV